MALRWEKVVNRLRPPINPYATYTEHMFLGEHTHALDDKKRLTLPAKLRKAVGKNIVVTRGLDGCLFLYTGKEWQGIAGKLGSLGMGQADTRGFARFMLAPKRRNAFPIDMGLTIANVPGVGLEPTRPKPGDFKSPLSTIPSPRLYGRP